MSEKRTVNVDIDINTMEATAKDLNWSVRNNTQVQGYGRRMYDGVYPLVIAEPGRSLSIGFRTNDQGKVEATYDDMAQRSFNKIMPYYKEKLTTQSGYKKGFRVHNKIDSKDKITLYLKRW